ncbi:MAG: methylated-DNA--[protein]-cysteine S-methyltransferase [Verrucomicrobiota bacterium]|nr:methylated-DNA--[protein]-cysteine S-methyltransferase [Opitutales bacterium]
MRQYYDTFSTPVGDFSVAVDANGSVIAAAFGGLVELRERFAADDVLHDPARLAAARGEITDYFSGKRTAFTLPLAPSGTPFQQSVWTALRRIPFGTTRSYGELAADLGNPGAARAIGRANATNPICLLIPCHRVIGGDGSLTGYAFGEALKSQLLAHEGVATVG